MYGGQWVTKLLQSVISPTKSKVLAGKTSLTSFKAVRKSFSIWDRTPSILQFQLEE
jgi:hypothetical protein